jgi:hypothetical protein
MSVQQPTPTSMEENAQQPDRFRALCSELEEYEHLPELSPGMDYPTHPLTGQNHEDAIDASILAGLTLP